VQAYIWTSDLRIAVYMFKCNTSFISALEVAIATPTGRSRSL
jgi:hypothetical protein